MTTEFARVLQNLIPQSMTLHIGAAYYEDGNLRYFIYHTDREWKPVDGDITVRVPSVVTSVQLRLQLAWPTGSETDFAVSCSPGPAIAEPVANDSQWFQLGTQPVGATNPAEYDVDVHSSRKRGPSSLHISVEQSEDSIEESPAGSLVLEEEPPTPDVNPGAHDWLAVVSRVVQLGLVQQRLDSSAKPANIAVRATLRAIHAQLETTRTLVAELQPNPGPSGLAVMAFRSSPRRR